MNKTTLYRGVTFVWYTEKARTNEHKHNITFEQAMDVFFDPFLRVTDATSSDECRDAVIGFDAKARLLFVVHIEQTENQIRIISARQASSKEEEIYAN